MGVWNETEARRRIDEAMRRKRAISEARALIDGKILPAKERQMMFDAVEEERKRKVAQKLLDEEEARMRELGVGGGSLEVGIQWLSLGRGEMLYRGMVDEAGALRVLDTVRSIRGLARIEYARVHGALGALYYDLVRARTHADPVLFRRYRDPKEQAGMLRQLRRFGEADTAEGWMERQERLESMMGIFENAALREFEA